MKAMRQYDAIVAGGGPGGAVCARELAAHGCSVLLLERDAPDRYKPCAGGVSPRTAFITPTPPGVVEREIKAARIFSPAMREVTMSLGGSVGWIVYRHRYDAALREMAAAAGAKVLCRAEVTDIAVCADRVSVSAATAEGPRTFTARTLVGAFGLTHGMKFLRRLGITPPRPILCACIEAALPEKQLDERVGDTAEFYFGTRIVPAGYAWVYPKRAGASLGLATRNPTEGGSLRVRLMDFVVRHPIASKKIAGWQPLFGTLKNSTFGHLIPLHPAERSFGDRFVLVGDAAGAADPLTGEGIYHAQVSGKIAAEVLAEQLEGDDLSAVALRRYETLWRERLHDRGTRYTGIICGLIDNFRDQDAITELLVELADRDKAVNETMMSVFSGLGSSREAFARVMTLRNLALTVRRLGWRAIPLAAAGARMAKKRKD